MEMFIYDENIREGKVLNSHFNFFPHGLDILFYTVTMSCFDTHQRYTLSITYYTKSKAVAELSFCLSSYNAVLIVEHLNIFFFFATYFPNKMTVNG